MATFKLKDPTFQKSYCLKNGKKKICDVSKDLKMRRIFNQETKCRSFGKNHFYCPSHHNNMKAYVLFKNTCYIIQSGFSTDIFIINQRT